MSEQKRFEFVPGDEIVIAPGRTVKRIRALVAIALFAVSPGDLGGYIENAAQVYGDAWVSGNARVYGNAQVYGNAWVYGDARVYGDAQKTPILVSGLHWQVTITDSQMTIGCQSHELTEWQNFDDCQIAEMDGKNALRFWQVYKDVLLTIARENGRM